jgi:hypothetical protein
MPARRVWSFALAPMIAATDAGLRFDVQQMAETMRREGSPP